MSAPAPFSCRYHPQFPELLHRLHVTLAVSTYQAGKLVFLSAPDEHRIVQLPRTFEKAMGIAEHPATGQLALACRHEIITFTPSAELAQHYPKAPGRYDALYLPRLTYHTGPLDVHDLSYGTDGQIFGVNTLFSCLMTVDGQHNFVPYWQPDFITELAAEDRCHLNGMALEHGRPRYVTAFNRGNTRQSWRDRVTETGVLLDVTDQRVVAEGLAMPHTPRLFNDQLYVLLSARGEVVRIDRHTGAGSVVAHLGGFLRGMTLVGDYLFVGRSKLRKNSSTFAHLDVPDALNRASIVAVHLPTGSVAGEITWSASLDEIYDVHALVGKRRPNILNTRTDDHHAAVMTPQSSYWGKRRENGDASGPVA